MPDTENDCCKATLNSILKAIIDYTLATTFELPLEKNYFPDMVTVEIFFNIGQCEWSQERYTCSKADAHN
mgnify:CR=1 FL=1